MKVSFEEKSSSGAHFGMLAADQPDASPIRVVVSYYGSVNLIEG
jgi:hypothetical protein